MICVFSCENLKRKGFLFNNIASLTWGRGGGWIIFVFVTKLPYSLSINSWHEASFASKACANRKFVYFVFKLIYVFASICKSILVSSWMFHIELWYVYIYKFNQMMCSPQGSHRKTYHIVVMDDEFSWQIAPSTG